MDETKRLVVILDQTLNFLISTILPKNSQIFFGCVETRSEVHGGHVNLHSSGQTNCLPSMFSLVANTEYGNS